MFRLDNKKALITGASGGIGQKIVQCFIEQGASVVGTVRNIDKVKHLKEQYEKEFTAITTDFNNRESLNRLIEFIQQEDRIDILVLNAGINDDSLLMRMKESSWDRVLEVNLKNQFLLLQSVIKLMLKKRYGRIIGISSIVGLVGNPGQSNYAASKAGMLGMLKSLAKEVGSRNITVNAITPGFVDTPMIHKLEESYLAEILGHNAIPRVGHPKEIASGVVFLASEEASYITGSVLKIAGGMDG